MNQDGRGSISNHGNMLFVENALVEEVNTRGRTGGYILISYRAWAPNGTETIEQLRLNVSNNTLILNSIGLPMCICDIRRGMWIDALFSPRMTRSIPPQTNAFLIVARRERGMSVEMTTDRIAGIDTRNSFLYTGNSNDINDQMRFVITDSTVITDRDGMRISLGMLRVGQMVQVTHANFQTASIPPQTTAFHVQVL